MRSLSKQLSLCLALCWPVTLGSCTCSKESRVPAPQTRSTFQPIASTPALTATSPQQDAAVAQAPEPLELRWGKKLESHIVHAELLTGGTGDFRLHRLKGAILGTHGGAAARYEEGRLTRVTLNINRGFIREFHVLTGVWPSKLWGSAVVGAPMDSPMGVWHEFDLTVITGTAESLRIVDGSLPVQWNRGRTLTLNSGQFQVASGKNEEPLPRITLGKTTACGDRFLIKDFDASPDGRVVAVGPSCEYQGMLDAEIWEPDTAEGTTQNLPGSDSLPRKACPSPTCVEPQLLEAWSETEIAVLVGAKRTSYVLAKAAKQSMLWRLAAAGWQKVALPAAPDVLSLTVDSQGRLWMASFEPHPLLARLEREGYREIVMPSEAGLQSALGNPTAAPVLAIRPTSVVEQEGVFTIGASLVEVDHGAIRGLAVLELGPAPSQPEPSTGGAPSDRGASLPDASSTVDAGAGR